ncbi:MAG: hypothetical protein ACX98W_14985, partial [bacterium]
PRGAGSMVDAGPGRARREARSTGSEGAGACGAHRVGPDRRGRMGRVLADGNPIDYPPTA